jgi:hypothetical protein
LHELDWTKNSTSRGWIIVKNIEQELKKNIRWIALKSGKTNKQVMDDIKKFEKILFGNDRKAQNK